MPGLDIDDGWQRKARACQEFVKLAQRCGCSALSSWAAVGLEPPEGLKLATDEGWHRLCELAVRDGAFLDLYAVVRACDCQDVDRKGLDKLWEELAPVHGGQQVAILIQMLTAGPIPSNWIERHAKRALEILLHSGIAQRLHDGERGEYVELVSGEGGLRRLVGGTWVEWWVRDLLRGDLAQLERAFPPTEPPAAGKGELLREVWRRYREREPEAAVPLEALRFFWAWDRALRFDPPVGVAIVEHLRQYAGTLRLLTAALEQWFEGFPTDDDVVQLLETHFADRAPVSSSYLWDHVFSTYLLIEGATEASLDQGAAVAPQDHSTEATATEDPVVGPEERTVYLEDRLDTDTHEDTATEDPWVSFVNRMVYYELRLNTDRLPPLDRSALLGSDLLHRTTFFYTRRYQPPLPLDRPLVPIIRPIHGPVSWKEVLTALEELGYFERDPGLATRVVLLALLAEHLPGPTQWSAYKAMLEVEALSELEPEVLRQSAAPLVLQALVATWLCAHPRHPAAPRWLSELEAAADLLPLLRHLQRLIRG